MILRASGGGGGGGGGSTDTMLPQMYMLQEDTWRAAHHTHARTRTRTVFSTLSPQDRVHTSLTRTQYINFVLH